jgi:hypothetical protein
VPAAEHRIIGHPKDRFPLTIYAERVSSTGFEPALLKAVAQWNRVSQQALGLTAFKWAKNRRSADVVILFNASHEGHEMGATTEDADDRGDIRLPVEITIASPTSRGGTNARQMFFDVTAHELGHALGLRHINKADSIMCCDPGGISFNDAATRDAYIRARQHPDLSIVAPELRTHYREFWKQQSSSAGSP